MKRFSTPLVALLLLLFLLLGCVPGDPVLDDFYTRSIYPHRTDTYNLGSAVYRWANGNFQTVTVGGTSVLPLTYVPYSGATGTVNLNAKQLTNFNPLLLNNVPLQWKDAGGTTRDVVNFFNWLDILPGLNYDAIFWLSSGTGRKLYLWPTASDAGNTTRDSPTLDFNANYWTGVTNANWEAKILHDMVTAGASPKSRLNFSINAVDIMTIQNNAGDVKVGVGTTDPRDLLTVDGGNLYVNAVRSDTAGTSGVWLSGTYNLIRTDTSNSLVFDYYNAGYYPGLSIRTSTGNISIGGATFGATAAGVLGIHNGTAPTSSPADGVQLWAEDIAASSELRVRDEAGNVTTLSPHPPEQLAGNTTSQYPWGYYSRNDYLGKEIFVDLAVLAEEVEKLSGKKLITINDVPKRSWADDQEANRVVRQTEIDKAVAELARMDSLLASETDAGKKATLTTERNKIVIPEPYTKKDPPQWMLDRGVK